MQFLKALVIGMGVLIVLGMGLLAYGLVSKTGKSPAEQNSADAVKNFGELALAGNGACRIERSKPDGSRLIIELTSASENVPAPACEKIIIVDMVSGTVIGSIVLQP